MKTKQQTITILLFMLFSAFTYSQTNQLASLKTTEKEIKITLYPNPTKGIIHIQCNEPIDYIKLYNKHGKQVLKTFVKEQTIDLTSLENGFYLFYAYVDGKQIKRGILKKM